MTKQIVFAAVTLFCSAQSLAVGLPTPNQPGTFTRALPTPASADCDLRVSIIEVDRRAIPPALIVTSQLDNAGAAGCQSFDFNTSAGDLTVHPAPIAVVGPGSCSAGICVGSEELQPGARVRVDWLFEGASAQIESTCVDVVASSGSLLVTDSRCPIEPCLLDIGPTVRSLAVDGSPISKRVITNSCPERAVLEGTLVDSTFTESAFFEITPLTTGVTGGVSSANEQIVLSVSVEPGSQFVIASRPGCVSLRTGNQLNQYCF